MKTFCTILKVIFRTLEEINERETMEKMKNMIQNIQNATVGAWAKKSSQTKRNILSCHQKQYPTLMDSALMQCYIHRNNKERACSVKV